MRRRPRYPRPVLIAICIALSLAVAGHVMSDIQETGSQSLKTRVHHAPSVPAHHGPGAAKL